MKCFCLLTYLTLPELSAAFSHCVMFQLGRMNGSEKPDDAPKMNKDTTVQVHPHPAPVSSRWCFGKMKIKEILI